jgi:hypothetical protein
MPETHASVKPGHGDHWLAALPPGDPRLLSALEPPLDAPDGLSLRRGPLTDALDLVQVTLRRRLVTAYPEPRATILLQVRPRELAVWDTRVEGWLTADHLHEGTDGAGALTFFLTDLAAQAHRYAAAKGPVALEAAALAYHVEPVPPASRVSPRLAPAARADARFLPDDYWFEGEVQEVHPTPSGEVVVDLTLQNGLELPVVTRVATQAAPGDHLQGYLWLTGRLPAAVDAPRAGASGKIPK